MKKVLITGAGSGFGLEAAMRLAEKGFDVTASVEIYSQVQPLKRAALARGIHLQVEKLDVTNEGDRFGAPVSGGKNPVPNSKRAGGLQPCAFPKSTWAGFEAATCSRHAGRKIKVSSLAFFEHQLDRR